ncbi:uncharacterized protein [Diadema antillarum]|uniref:uncharacterized protein n=1 Tax=Diadema antillarum TaxID=105358 RepID=UPI003A88A5FB
MLLSQFLSQFCVSFLSTNRATVSFRFLQSYASIQSQESLFISQLASDLRSRYSFTDQQIETVQVSEAENGAIQVDFALDIDTTNNGQVTNRGRLSNDLSSSTYIFLFTNSSGTPQTYLVDGDSSSVSPSFWDQWHQYAPDVFLAIIVMLGVFAVFCAAAHCIRLYGRKRRMKYSTDRDQIVSRPAADHANGIDNEGFVVEMTEIYTIKAAGATPIPTRAQPPVEPVVTPTPTRTEERVPEVPPAQSLVPASGMISSKPNSPSPTVTPPESPPQSALSTTPHIKSSETSNSSATLSSLRLSKATPTPLQSPPGGDTPSPRPPGSPSLVQRVAAIPGSVRSLPQFLGVSTHSSPSSSRRTSMAEPSIYARLLFSSYSVPPKKIYDYV